MEFPEPVALAVRAAGSPAKLAQEIGIAGPSIYRWKSVPVDRVPAISERYGIPRHLLCPERPDLFPPPTDEG